MVRITTALALAATAGALFAGSAQASSTVCVNEPATNGVYRGCTYVDTTTGCVQGGGTIVNKPYRLSCP